MVGMECKPEYIEWFKEWYAEYHWRMLVDGEVIVMGGQFIEPSSVEVITTDDTALECWAEDTVME